MYFPTWEITNLDVSLGNPMKVTLKLWLSCHKDILHGKLNILNLFFSSTELTVVYRAEGMIQPIPARKHNNDISIFNTKLRTQCCPERAMLQNYVLNVVLKEQCYCVHVKMKDWTWLQLPNHETLLGSIHSDANKWVQLTSMELFTFNDAKHQRKKTETLTLTLTVNRPLVSHT